MKNLSLACLIIFFAACSSAKNAGSSNYGSPKIKQELINDLTFKVTQYSHDKTYGYSEKNPVMVGGPSDGPKNERRFLNALAGPNGETVKYNRLGSCCPFKTKNSEWGGMLDKYQVSFDGTDKSVIIYINMYDSDTLKVPVGFTLKKQISSPGSIQI